MDPSSAWDAVVVIGLVDWPVMISLITALDATELPLLGPQVEIDCPLRPKAGQLVERDPACRVVIIAGGATELSPGLIDGEIGSCGCGVTDLDAESVGSTAGMRIGAFSIGGGLTLMLLSTTGDTLRALRTEVCSLRRCWS